MSPLVYPHLHLYAAVELHFPQCRGRDARSRRSGEPWQSAQLHAWNFSFRLLVSEPVSHEGDMSATVSRQPDVKLGGSVLWGGRRAAPGTHPGDSIDSPGLPNNKHHSVSARGSSWSSRAPRPASPGLVIPASTTEVDSQTTHWGSGSVMVMVFTISAGFAVLFAVKFQRCRTNMSRWL